MTASATAIGRLVGPPTVGLGLGDTEGLLLAEGVGEGELVGVAVGLCWGVEVEVGFAVFAGEGILAGC